MKIGIVGYGHVGKAMHGLFKNARLYDKCSHIGSKEEINSCDTVFVCVPTPQCADGNCDTSIVEEVIDWLDVPLIILRSTVYVGFTDEMDKVTQDMTKAIPTNFDTTINSEFKNPTLLPNGQQSNGEIYNVINIDGRSFASVITPYVSKRQYTALGGAF